jgi:glycosyltransferase involved in cell wall biosynthesis
VRRLLWPRLGTLRHHDPRPLRIPARYTAPRRVAACPTISLVTPTLDSARFVEATVCSVLDQGYERLEYAVQDGSSRDETLEILGRYRTRLASIASAPDRGQSEALNRGFARTTGEVMAYLNADDLLLPGALHYVGAFFGTHPDVDVVYGHRVLIDATGAEIGRWVLPPHEDRALLWEDYVPQETVFWRRRIWDRAGARFDERLQFAMDWDLLLRFRRAGARFRRVPRFLGAFRIHADQKTSAQMAVLGQAEIARLREREHGRPIPAALVSRRVRGYLWRHIVYQKLYRLGILRY